MNVFIAIFSIIIACIIIGCSREAITANGLSLYDVPESYNESIDEISEQKAKEAIISDMAARKSKSNSRSNSNSKSNSNE